MNRFFFLFLFVFVPFLALAQSPKPATLEAIAFVEGHWKGTFNGGPIEAGWTAPEAGNIMGYIRMMKDNKISMYEILVFEQTDNGIAEMVKHFKAGLIGVEEKDKPDRYRLIEASGKQALFEKEDASIRVIFELRTPNQLIIQRGEKKTADWAFSNLFVFDRVK